MQLEACLRSIRHFAPYTGSPIVIYKATSPRFDEGYELLVNSGQATFIEQSSFESAVRHEARGEGVVIRQHSLCLVRRERRKAKPLDE